MTGRTIVSWQYSLMPPILLWRSCAKISLYRTEEDLKALQSVGQIIGNFIVMFAFMSCESSKPWHLSGELLRQLDEERYIVKASSGPRYVVGCRNKVKRDLLKPGVSASSSVRWNLHHDLNYSELYRGASHSGYDHSYYNESAASWGRSSCVQHGRRGSWQSKFLRLFPMSKCLTRCFRFPTLTSEVSATKSDKFEKWSSCLWSIRISSCVLVSSLPKEFFSMDPQEPGRLC